MQVCKFSTNSKEGMYVPAVYVLEHNFKTSCSLCSLYKVKAETIYRIRPN